MEPTDKLFGSHCSRSGDYGCSAGTFNQQQEQEEDLMSSSLFMLSDSPPSSLWLTLPPEEGFAAPGNFGDGQISPLAQMPFIPPSPLVATHGTESGQLAHNLSLPNTTFDNDLLFCSPEEEVQQVMMSLQPVHPPMPLDWLSNTTNGAPADFGDSQISPSLDDMPYIPVAVAEEAANYDAALAAPLVATHGTGTGQLSSNSSVSLSSTTSYQFGEEVQQAMMSLLHPPMMAPYGLSNTTGGPAARNHADAVPPLVQQDELHHPQQQLPLLTNDPGAQPGGVWAWPHTPTIWPSQPASPSPTPVINPGPDEANHAASAPMGSQGTLIPAAPLQHQETDIVSRASTQPRAIKSSRGLPSRLQDGSDNLFDMGIDLLRQLGRYIGKTREKQKQMRPIVWQQFWRSKCKYCHMLTVICQYCNTVMRDSSTFEMFTHLESYEYYKNNIIHLLPASSRASKETQRSSQALKIKEIPENPNGESEPIEVDNSNCATAARVDTQGTNTVVLSPRQQHQLQMDREEQMATILSSCEPCCQGLDLRPSRPSETAFLNLLMRFSESSCCSSTAKSTHDGFRLKSSKNSENSKIVHVHSSAAWMHVTENRSCKHQPELEFGPFYVCIAYKSYDYTSAPAGCASSWQNTHVALCALGFRKEFARDLVIYALALVNGCHLRLWSPSSSNKGKSIVEQVGDASSGKRKRKPAPPRSKVWNHFKKLEVEAEGSAVTIAKCNYCGSELKAGSASHGTTHLARHIRSIHPEQAKSL